jgi:hypothetical protein
MARAQWTHKSLVFNHRMKSEEQQYNQHQMDFLTHNNASTGALCLHPEYPWSHRHGRFQIFSLFLLELQKRSSNLVL